MSHLLSCRKLDSAGRAEDPEGSSARRAVPYLEHVPMGDALCEFERTARLAPHVVCFVMRCFRTVLTVRHEAQSIRISDPDSSSTFASVSHSGHFLISSPSGRLAPLHAVRPLHQRDGFLPREITENLVPPDMPLLVDQEQVVWRVPSATAHRNEVMTISPLVTLSQWSSLPSFLYRRPGTTSGNPSSKPRDAKQLML